MSDKVGGGGAITLPPTAPPLPGWSFVALGKPVPQGSKVANGGGRKGVRDSNGDALKPWRDTVTAAGFGAGPKLAGPVRVLMVFTRAKPKGAPKRTPYQPSVAPDCDKEARSVFDSVTVAGLWGDDGQVVDLHVRDVAVGESAAALPVPGVIVAACCSVTVDGSTDEQMRLAGLFHKAWWVAWCSYRGEEVAAGA